MSRLLKHLLHTPLATRRAFPADVQEAIRKTIADGEQLHRGEIRLVVEGDWPLLDVIAGKAVRDRALELFGLSRVWDTAENTGLLIYVLLCEHRVEILADRGLQAVASDDTWAEICKELTTAFHSGLYKDGCVQAVRSVNDFLLRHFPSDGHNPNELPDLPIVLR
ncbi:MAG: Psb32 and founding s of phosphatase family protein [Moraxellaceae bacterium]|nr:Psb32 and founding s of phosphatase family protein [Moraxellaceae bacterium]